MKRPFFGDFKCRKNVHASLETIESDVRPLEGSVLITGHTPFGCDCFQTLLFVCDVLGVGLQLFKYLGVVFRVTDISLEITASTLSLSFRRPGRVRCRRDLSRLRWLRRAVSWRVRLDRRFGPRCHPVRLPQAGVCQLAC